MYYTVLSIRKIIRSRSRMKMYNKKPTYSASNDKSSSTVQSEVVATLMNVQEKLNNPVFNGGFETLTLKLEGIEKVQQQTLEQVSDLNKTIFDPDEGLYSRIKTVNQDVSELTLWKKSVDEKSKENNQNVIDVKSLTEWKKSVDEKVKKYDENLLEVTKIKDWKGNIQKFFVWILPAIGLLLLKQMFEFIIQHIVIK